MTYCVGLLLDEGLVMLADTRTNAGVDNISSFAKLKVFSRPGDRMIATMSAGNLAISQAVINLLQEGLTDAESGETHTIHTVPTMFRAAALVGEAIRHVYRTDGKAMAEHGLSFDVSFLLGGQIKDRSLRLFQVYSAGNFIEATGDTPFLQIGEHKYGKPILDRAVTPATTLIDGVKLCLISMDSTLRSNLSVGAPLDLMVYPRDSDEAPAVRRIDEDDAYFRSLRSRWDAAVREAHVHIPPPEWVLGGDR